MPRGEKKLLVEAFLLVVLTRLIFWVVPFKLFRKRFAGVLSEKTNFEQVDWQKVKKIAGAVKTVSRIVPSASCLTQALAAFWLIKLNGQHSELKIGVARDARTELAAHAWLEINGRVILGNSPSHRNFTILDTFSE